MKRIYSKPDIMFEDFTLSTSIAAGCAITNPVQTQDVCAVRWNMGGDYINIFNSGVGACDPQFSPIFSENDSICYHNPSDENRLFNS